MAITIRLRDFSLITEAAVIPAEDANEIADIAAAFLDIPVNLITVKDNELSFEKDGSKFRIIVGKDFMITGMNKENKVNHFNFNGRTDGFEFTLKPIGAYDKVYKKLKSVIEQANKD